MWAVSLSYFQIRNSHQLPHSQRAVLQKKKKKKKKKQTRPATDLMILSVPERQHFHWVMADSIKKNTVAYFKTQASKPWS